MRFDFGELELQEALLDRVVGRDLQGDGACPVEIAEHLPVLDDSASEVCRALGFFDEPRRPADTLLGGTGVMVIGEQPPRNVFPFLAAEVQASFTEIATRRASLRHGQGIPLIGSGHQHQLSTVPKGDTPKNSSTTGAAPVAEPGASAEAEPSSGPGQLLRRGLPEKPCTEPGYSTTGPPPRNRGASRRGSNEGEFPMPRCSVCELPPIPPPSLLGEVCSAYPNDIELASAQKGDVIGL